MRSSEIELREILTGREPVIKLRTTGRVAFEMAIATFLIDAVIIIGNATRRRPRHASGLLGRVAGAEGVDLTYREAIAVATAIPGAPVPIRAFSVQSCARQYVERVLVPVER